MEITQKFKDSIQERCCESDTGRIIIPTDILNKYIKITNQEHEDRHIVRSQIINIARE